jgi:hypothetical protein
MLEIQDQYNTIIKYSSFVPGTTTSSSDLGSLPAFMGIARKTGESRYIKVTRFNQEELINKNWKNQ